MIGRCLASKAGVTIGPAIERRNLRYFVLRVEVDSVDVTEAAKTRRWERCSRSRAPSFLAMGEFIAAETNDGLQALRWPHS